MRTTLFGLSLFAAVFAVTACSGRSPDVARNDDAPVSAPSPEPPPHVRALVDRKLFGTMPVKNRLQDPLMTFTGSGWFAFANDFQSYPPILRVVDQSPTQTAFLTVPQGASLLGQLKTERAPLHVEVWLGRDGKDADLADASAALVGLFAGSGGDQTVPLTADASSKTTLGNRTWQRYTADLDEGPIGWAFLLVDGGSAAVNAGGAVAVDVSPGANADFVSSKKRAPTPLEQRLVDAARAKSRNLKPPADPVAARFPGLPPASPR